MAASIQAQLEQAVRLHRQGGLAEAEKLYRAVLARQPDNFGSLHHLAMLLMQQGKPLQAAECARAAVKHHPASGDALMLLGSILLGMNNFDEALRQFDGAVAIEPNNVNARYNRAMALSQADRLPQALADFDQVVRSEPRDGSAWMNRGLVLARLRRPEDALASLDRALALAPNDPDALNNRGNALAALQRYEDALQSFNRLLALRPNHIDGLSNRANTLNALRRADEALADCDRALSIKADHINSLVTRGTILHHMARYDDALVAYERALALAPRDAEVICNRSLSLLELGRFQEALVDAERAMAIAPKDARAHATHGKALQALSLYAEAADAYQLGLKLDPDVLDAAFNLRICRLKLAHFEAGWSHYEPKTRRYPQPRWNGEAVSGTLLIWSDDGIGDQIIYASVIPDLKDLAGQIVLEVDPRLVALFGRSFPDVTVDGIGPQPYAGHVDAQDVIAGPVRHLRKSWAAFPALERGFLKSDGEKVHRLRETLAGDGQCVIGLSWISKSPTLGRFKSARLMDFEALLRQPGYRFVDLQYGDTAAERLEVERKFGVRVQHLDAIDNMNDFDSLAALVSACDAVLTVSNVTAHLAGAVGTRTFAMVPTGRGNLWYWFIDRPDSPWYPRLQVRYHPHGRPWPEMVAAIAPEVTDAALMPWSASG